MLVLKVCALIFHPAALGCFQPNYPPFLPYMPNVSRKLELRLAAHLLAQLYLPSDKLYYYKFIQYPLPPIDLGKCGTRSNSCMTSYTATRLGMGH